MTLRTTEHGSGEPLVLLHGGLGAGEQFAPILPALRGRRVITVDLAATAARPTRAGRCGPRRSPTTSPS